MGSVAAVTYVVDIGKCILLKMLWKKLHLIGVSK